MPNLWEGKDANTSRYDGSEHFRSISIHYWTLDALLSRQYDESCYIDEEHASSVLLSRCFKSFFRTHHR